MRSLGTFRNQHSSRLRTLVEPLENRLCLSVTVATVDVDGSNQLQITSDDEGDTINIAAQANGAVEVTDADGNVLGSAENVTSIRVEAGGGDDVVNYTLTDALTQSQALMLHLGAGNDQANVDLSAGLGEEAELSVNIKGDAGDDTITGTLGNLAADARLNFHADGGAGMDAITVEGLETEIDALAAVRVKLAGGKGVDTLNTTIDGSIMGRLSVDTNGGKDDDTIATNITAAAGSTGRIAASVRGDKGDDDLTLNVIDNSGEEGDSLLSRVRATIHDRHGENTIVNTDNVRVLGGKALGHLADHFRGNGFAFGRGR